MNSFDFNRRRLLAAGVAAPFVVALQGCAVRTGGQRVPAASPYGPLRPVEDLSSGLPLLQLPEGFSYASFSWTGDAMADGEPTPARHDGMAVVAEQDGPEGRELVLVRNHENGSGRLIRAPACYDSAKIGVGEAAQPLAGGTTNLCFRLGAHKWVSAEGSLGGTLINCAGGPTPWGSWLSCEETLADLSSQGGRRHGYVFEVTADPAETSGKPIVGMGRFEHEAVAVDLETGIVYLTEDSRNRAGLYRYAPIDRSARPGALACGGQLQAAKVKGVSRADLLAPALGQVVELEWVEIAEPDAGPAPFNGRHASGTASGPFLQARAAGGLRMSRGEGIWYHDGRMYIVDTSAGRGLIGGLGYGAGCVWMLDLASMRMEAIFVSATAVAGDNPDNITVSPRGGILMCEDGKGVVDQFGVGSRLLGLNAEGKSYIFAKNNVQLSAAALADTGKRVQEGDYRHGEFSGACFDGQGRVLFVNAQNPGITFAIWGPWEHGPL